MLYFIPSILISSSGIRYGLGRRTSSVCTDAERQEECLRLIEEHAATTISGASLHSLCTWNNLRIRLSNRDDDPLLLHLNSHGNGYGPMTIELRSVIPIGLWTTHGDSQERCYTDAICCSTKLGRSSLPPPNAVRSERRVHKKSAWVSEHPAS